MARDRANALWAIALAIAGVYLVVFVARFPHNLTEMTWDPDYAGEYLMAETVARTGTEGHAVIASSGQWVGLWFAMLTARLPLHRELWYLTPTLAFVLTALIVGWSVREISNRRAATLAALICLVASPPAVAFLIAPGAHNTVYLCTALLGAYVIYLTQAHERGRLATLAVPPLLGVFVGVCLSSDLLLAATAIFPFALTAILATLARDRRSLVLALSALVTVAVAVPVAMLTTATMHLLGFLTIKAPQKLVPLSELPERLRYVFDGLKTLFNGSLGPAVPDPLHDSVGSASVVVMSVALLGMVLLGISTATRFIWSSLSKRGERTPTQLASSLHVIYWVASAASACGAFWLAAETRGGTDLHNSYYATVILSVAATIPLLLSTGSRARWLIAIGVSIFFAGSLIRLTGNYLDLAGARASTAPGIERAAATNHVTYGYGSYGEASNLTWSTAGDLTSRPLLECRNPTGAVNLCPFYMSSVPSWYVPRKRHTFLLINSQEPWIAALPRGLGKPLASYQFGPVSMYIYPYDIAAVLGPQPAF